MAPQILNKEEGESLTLTCEVSKATAQHTHLSVSWYRMQGGERSQATRIISLSRDFMLVPGPLYTQRFSAHDVGLSKLGASTFRLFLGSLQPSDQGEIFCEATEWIQDPDETWTLIGKKQTNGTTLTIRPAARDLQVSLRTESTFVEGESLDLVCMVLTEGRNPQLQGIWFFNNREIAHIGANGVLGFQDSYRDRASKGQLQVSKTDPKTFSLKILTAGPEDEGTYQCEVEELSSGQMGAWLVLQRKRSPDSHVRLRQPAVATRQVVVSTRSQQQAMWEGEPLTLLCQVGGPEASLSVSWWHTPQDQVQPEFVAEMDHNGTVQRRPSPGEPNTRLEKVNWATFQLEIFSTTVIDSGTYECRVSERTRTQARNQSWSQNVSVKVHSLKSSLQVILNSRQPQVMLTSAFGLNCLVKANYSDLLLPLTITWMFQSTSSQYFHQLLQLTHDGTIEWGNSSMHFQRKTKVSRSSFLSQLIVHDVTEQEAGVFQCKADVYDRNSFHTTRHARASAASHPLRIRVTALRGQEVRVSKERWAENATEHEEMAIPCRLENPRDSASLLSVMWFRNQGSSGSKMLVHLRHDGLLVYGEESLRPHLHCFRANSTDFVLQLRRVELGDAGKYWCEVKAWQMHGTSWISLAVDQSQHLELIVLPAESTFAAKICSSTWLLYLFTISPFVLSFLLLMFSCFLCWKVKKLSAQKQNRQNTYSLWDDVETRSEESTAREKKKSKRMKTTEPRELYNL